MTPIQPLIELPRMRRVVGVAASGVSLVLAMLTLGALFHWRDARLLAGGLVTALMVHAAVRMATTNPQGKDIYIFRTLGCSMIFGILNTPLVFIAVVLVDGQFEALTLAPVVLMFGTPVGLVLGALFGLALEPPLRSLGRARLHPTPATLDRCAMVIGGWMFAMPVLAVLFDPRTFTRWKLHIDGGAITLPVALDIAATVAAAGAGLGLLALHRYRQRRRFITRVAAGSAAGWVIIESPPPSPQLDRLPCLDVRRDECRHVLCRDDTRPGHAYRRGDLRQPVAWVPAAWVGSVPRADAHRS